MKGLRKLIRLTAAEQRLLAIAWFYLIATKLGLILLPLRALLSWSAKVGVSRAHQLQRPKSSWPAERVAWAIQAASRYVPGGGNCLLQAIATQVVLARSGVSADVRIGAAKDRDKRFKAHAWLEHEGRILVGGAGVSEFSAFPRVDARGR